MSQSASNKELRDEKPSFAFFVATPADMMLHPPLASSLQSFETCLFLIALGRFPSALASCATAIESVIKAKLGTPPEDKVRLWELIQRIRQSSRSLGLCDETKLDEFRDIRNRLVHYGYTPKDDEVCAVQLLETGFPFLEKCYKELFGFDLNWPYLDHRVAEQYRVCREVYRRARQLRGISYRYCFDSLAHCIRFGLKENSITATEADILQLGADMGVKYEREAKKRANVERTFKSVTWEFDCPICSEVSSMIAELDEEELRNKSVRVRRCFCITCEMLVSEGSPYLGDQLLRIPIDVVTEIRKEFGVW